MNQCRQVLFLNSNDCTQYNKLKGIAIKYNLCSNSTREVSCPVLWKFYFEGSSLWMLDHLQRIKKYLALYCCLLVEEWINKKCRFASGSRCARSYRLISRWDVNAFLRKLSPQLLHLWLAVELASSHCSLDACIGSSFCK